MYVYSVHMDTFIINASYSAFLDQVGRIEVVEQILYDKCSREPQECVVKVLMIQGRAFGFKIDCFSLFTASPLQVLAQQCSTQGAQIGGLYANEATYCDGQNPALPIIRNIP